VEDLEMKRIMKQNEPNESLQIPPGGAADHTPYPDFQITNIDKWNFDWDEKTRRLIIDRVQNVPSYRFFSAEQAQLLEALCDCLLPQNDRTEAQRIPIAPWIDEGLYNGRGLGYRYENMPEDREAYRMGLQGFDQTAHSLFRSAFVDLERADQNEVMRQIAEGSSPGKIWKRLSATLFFQRLMSDVITNYYAHPAAWAEIGFNGPSSPRGHIRLRLDRRDPWEAREHQPHSSVEIVLRSPGKQKGPAKGGPTH
jgi:hypothetical protein